MAGFYLLLFLLFIGRCIDAQSPSHESSDSSNNNGPDLSPTFKAIIVVLLVGYFLLFFFICRRIRCTRFQQGINPEVLESFPTLVYSEVKKRKIANGALECAICISEFEDDVTIRLLPECDHVFHMECIDAWLRTHVTCPVCRTNYILYSPNPTSTIPARNDGAVPPEAVLPPDAAPAHHVAITVDDIEGRKEEMRELARSHSMGHTMMPQGEIIAAGKLQKARTFAVVAAGKV